MSTNTLRLFDIAQDYLKVLDELMAMEDLPEQAIKDTMEGMAGDFEEKAKHTAAFILNLEAEAKAIGEAEKRMKYRKQSLNNKAKSLKDYLHSNMKYTGIRNIKSPELVVKIQKNPSSVIIDSENSLPNVYKITETITKIMKADIGKALKSGVDVPGARLHASTRLVIA